MESVSESISNSTVTLKNEPFTFHVYSGQSESNILPEFQINLDEFTCNSIQNQSVPIPIPPVLKDLSIESKVQTVFETKSIQCDLIEFFFDRLGARFPFLYKPHFMNFISNMKEYVLYGIYALSKIHHPISCKEDAKSNELESKAYFDRAMKCLSQEPEDEWDHYHAGTLVILHQYAQVAGIFEELRILYADAYFKIIRLKLNLDVVLENTISKNPLPYPIPLSESVRECRRRVFWTFFVYDVTMGYQIGCATLLSNDQIHCRLPMTDEDLDKIHVVEAKYFYFSKFVY